MRLTKPDQVRARIRVDRGRRRRGATAAAYYNAVPARYTLGAKQ